MPKIVEKCVADLMADPKFKAKNPKQSKKDAAWAVCQAAHQNKKMGEDGTLPVGFADEYLLDIITFGEKVDYQIVPQLDGTVTIKNLPFFQLGFHKNFPFDQDWADQAISLFKAKKEKEGFIPPVFKGHKTSESDAKPVMGFINDMSRQGDLLFAEITKVPKDVAREYPYRSVEVVPAKQEITGLALLGADEIPYFKFAPVQFNENEESKINLTFKDEGGEDMSTFEFAQEDRSLLKGILDGITKFFSTKKSDDPSGDKKTFTEDEVKKRENDLKIQVKMETEKVQQVQFAEAEKKKDQTEMMKLLFAGPDQKEGLFLAPRLKGKVEAVFAKLDNLEKVKFSEPGTDGKDAEKEGTIYGMLREVFSEIMTKPDAWLPLGEKTRFSIATVPAGTGNDKVTMKEAEETATHVVQKFGSKRKKVEEKK